MKYGANLTDNGDAECQEWLHIEIILNNQELVSSSNYS
jgi:hypothetical protein